MRGRGAASGNPHALSGNRAKGRIMSGAKSTPPLALSDEQKKLISDSCMFDGSRRFLFAYQLLTKHDNSPFVREGRAPMTLQPRATCAVFSLELALKCRISLDGGKFPRKGREAHDCAALFSRYLFAKAQADVASGVRMATGKIASIGDVEDVLRQFHKTFETWRYLHEHMDGAVFHERDVLNVVAAVHESILRLHPDWRPWPGVIQEA